MKQKISPKTNRKDNSWYLAFKFISLSFILTLSLNFAISITNIPNIIAAYTSKLFLNTLFGIDASVLLNADFPIIQTQNLTAIIIDLCSGKLEIAILFGIIFASFEKKTNYKIKGFAVGVLLLLIFNAIRISTTIYFFDSGNIQWSAIFHDLLFRMFLVIIIVTYYAIWYYYDLPRKSKA
ncbi:exosortase/archaeosortase family protein [Candidatus Micrarchaeota archaeon]|nr:exosortase/archaeosortase family protein [Candidatus Micrarchaeota archaeon]